MSLKPIEKMTFEELRREVQILSDSLAKMKRFYEDALLNLDDDNFSSSIIKEKDGMKAQIKISAKEISTKVSTDTFESYKIQTATEIATKVSTSTLSNYSTTSQTAEKIQSTVVKYVDKQSAVTVSTVNEMTDTSAIYKIPDANGGYTYYYYDSNSNPSSWMPFTDSIYSVFTQTATGFNIKGNVTMDGGQITWSNANNPIKALYARTSLSKPQSSYASYSDNYSSQSPNWYKVPDGEEKYASYTYDNGTTWTIAVRIRGEDGTNGTNGADGVVDYSTISSLLSRNYGITKTVADAAHIESPEIYAGVFYSDANGGKVATMSSDGFGIYTSRNANPSAMLGCFNSDTSWAYPYLRLGIGSGNNTYDAGFIEKLPNGLWIGNNAISYLNGSAVIDGNHNPKGLLINFSDNKIYRYHDSWTGVDISTATAVFG